MFRISSSTGKSFETNERASIYYDRAKCFDLNNWMKINLQNVLHKSLCKVKAIDL